MSSSAALVLIFYRQCDDDLQLTKLFTVGVCGVIQSGRGTLNILTPPSASASPSIDALSSVHVNVYELVHSTERHVLTFNNTLLLPWRP